MTGQTTPSSRLERAVSQRLSLMFTGVAVLLFAVVLTTIDSFDRTANAEIILARGAMVIALVAVVDFRADPKVRQDRLLGPLLAAARARYLGSDSPLVKASTLDRSASDPFELQLVGLDSYMDAGFEDANQSVSLWIDNLDFGHGLHHVVADDDLERLAVISDLVETCISRSVPPIVVRPGFDEGLKSKQLSKNLETCLEVEVTHTERFDPSTSVEIIRNHGVCIVVSPPKVVLQRESFAEAFIDSVQEWSHDRKVIVASISAEFAHFVPYGETPLTFWRASLEQTNRSHRNPDAKELELTARERVLLADAKANLARAATGTLNPDDLGPAWFKSPGLRVLSSASIAALASFAGVVIAGWWYSVWAEPLFARYWVELRYGSDLPYRLLLQTVCGGMAIVFGLDSSTIRSGHIRRKLSIRILVRSLLVAAGAAWLLVGVVDSWLVGLTATVVGLGLYSNGTLTHGLFSTRRRNPVGHDLVTAVFKVFAFGVFCTALLIPWTLILLFRIGSVALVRSGISSNLLLEPLARRTAVAVIVFVVPIAITTILAELVTLRIAATSIVGWVAGRMPIRPRRALDRAVDAGALARFGDGSWALVPERLEPNIVAAPEDKPWSSGRVIGALVVASALVAAGFILLRGVEVSPTNLQPESAIEATSTPPTNSGPNSTEVASKPAQSATSDCSTLPSVEGGAPSTLEGIDFIDVNGDDISEAFVFAGLGANTGSWVLMSHRGTCEWTEIASFTSGGGVRHGSGYCLIEGQPNRIRQYYGSAESFVGDATWEFFVADFVLWPDQRWQLVHEQMLSGMESEFDPCEAGR